MERWQLKIILLNSTGKQITDKDVQITKQYEIHGSLEIASQKNINT